jgi:hypothetical protein
VTLGRCRGIGWVDNEQVYLVPDLAWAAVEEFNARAGWPYKKTQLHKQLTDAGIIKRDDRGDDAESRLTCRRSLGGKSPRVFVIDRAHFEGAIGDPETAKQAAEQEEKVRRDKLAESGVIIDDPDFDQLMN